MSMHEIQILSLSKNHVVLVMMGPVPNSFKLPHSFEMIFNLLVSFFSSWLGITSYFE